MFSISSITQKHSNTQLSKMTNVQTKPVEATHAILGKTSLEGVMLGISKFDTSKVLFKITNSETIKKLQKYTVNIKDDAVNIKLPSIKTDRLQKFGIYSMTNVALVRNFYKGKEFVTLVCIDKALPFKGFEVHEPQEYTDEMLEEVREIKLT